MNISFGYNIEFCDLYSQGGLKRIDALFLRELKRYDATLWHSLLSYRRTDGSDDSELLIAVSDFLDRFIGKLFGISDEIDNRKNEYGSLEQVAKCQELFIRRQVVLKFDANNQADRQELDDISNSIEEIAVRLIRSGIDLDDDKSIAEKTLMWLEEGAEESSLIRRYAIWAIFTNLGQKRHRGSALFRYAKKVSSDALIPNIEKTYDGSTASYSVRDDKVHNRFGFDCTDHAVTANNAMYNAKYCIYCHKRGKDSCSRGMMNKFSDEKRFAINSEQQTLHGCPLEEKISEMILLKSNGNIIGSMVMAMVDNPMLAATGHRICNDCMKSCIYQKQEPVDVPLVESRVLKDVLELSWGFEIYSLFSKWNPLKRRAFLPDKQKPHKILVAGLGPAGFTLSHCLLNSGYKVVGIDGLKIEPLPSHLSGITESGERVPFSPIKDINSIYEPLGKRVAYGFGGVAEYGITSRWDKNYLKIIRLILERNHNFRMYGGIRFGSNITYDVAKEIGFDHIALAIGAGKPNLPKVEGIGSRGVRTASEFLMQLHLGGVTQEHSVANMQIRMPVVVIGAGLTAIDAATESLAYYSTQVEKYLRLYERIGDDIFTRMDDNEKEIALEFLSHARRLREAKDHDRLEVLNSFGGVKIVYRKSLQESPAYRLNHEEVSKAFEEGIQFMESMTPVRVETDDGGNACALVCLDATSGEEVMVEARTVLVATGTNPNTIISEEDPYNFLLDNKDTRYFHAINKYGSVSHSDTVKHPKNADGKEIDHIFIASNRKDYKGGGSDENTQADGVAVSFFGDLHPSYAGSVVKAMSSSKNGVPIINDLLTSRRVANKESRKKFFSRLDGMLLARVVGFNTLADNVVEVIVHSPLAASLFKAGQFFKLQNYYHHTEYKKGADGVAEMMEPIALTGSRVDKKKGTISMIVLEMGGSSNLCRNLQLGETVSLMGPTGSPTVIPKDETVILVGGGLGNAVLLAVGDAMRKNGCRVIYFAGYRSVKDRYKTDEIKRIAHTMVWACDEKRIEASGEGEYSYQGNLVEAIESYALESEGAQCIGKGNHLSLKDASRMIVIGSEGMMASVIRAVNGRLEKYFDESLVKIASINSPMQCMMKGVCAQCIQRHVKDGKEYYVYSCVAQDQNADLVDFENLQTRLSQNSVQEKVSMHTHGK